MALPEPAWRVRTRPCPFYQQGRCLFGDTCNFVHSASIKVFADAHHTGEPYTPSKLPTISFESPGSVKSPSRSPRLSGLLYALRDVIGEDPDDDAGLNLEESGSFVQLQSFAGEASTTFVEETGSSPIFNKKFIVQNGDLPSESSLDFNLPGNIHGTDQQFDSEPISEASDYLHDSEQIWNPSSNFLVGSHEEDHSLAPLPNSQHFDSTPDSDQRNENIAEQSFSSSATDYEYEAIDADDDETLRVAPVREAILDVQPSIRTIESSPTNLLSPVDLSHLHLTPFMLHDDHLFTRDGDSIDSGYADSWKGPHPLVISPPRSPSISSTFDLLSSPFGSSSQRLLSPRLSAFIGRSPSSPHAPFSPQEDINPPELDLDSPEVHMSPETSLFVENTDELENAPPAHLESFPSPVQNLEEHVNAEEQEEAETEEELQEEEEEEPSFQSASIWEVDGADTAVFLGTDEPVQTEVNEAIKRWSTTPKHFLTSQDISFVEGEASSSSIVVDLEGAGQEEEDVSFEASDSILSDPDATAQLAYLASPALLNEGDTLNSLYDVYSAPLSEPTEAPGRPLSSIINSPHFPPTRQSSGISTPLSSSSLRERVFTPPPFKRERSSRADTSTSLASPVTSVGSPSGRPYSSSQLETHSTRSMEGQSPKDPEFQASTKVPFGFRPSFTLGRPRNSTLTAQRMSRNIPIRTFINKESGLPSADGQYTGSSSSNPRPGLKPLRLSNIAYENTHSSLNSTSRKPSFSVNTHHSYGNVNVNRLSSSSASVSSHSSISKNPLLSSARSSLIPEHIHNTQLLSHARSPSPLSSEHIIAFDEPQTAPLQSPSSWHNASEHVQNLSNVLSHNYSEPSLQLKNAAALEQELYEHDANDETVRRPLSIFQPPYSAPLTRDSLVSYPPMYAIATPRPTLMFAIASDNVEQVRQVLESGDAGPNDAVGPLSALEFVLTNDQLQNKMDIVKTLLAYGADPTIAKRQSGVPGDSSPKHRNFFDKMDPAIRYYVERADAPHTRRTSALIHRSFFRPLTRVRYELVGQDRALEQLFRVLSMHSRELSATPIVVLLCGPSGHGKSLLARKFGSLLDVPTHTVNMTTLRSTHDLWQSYSMSPYETPTTCTLAEFLINNEGKRCVVVLDEVEKTDEKTLWSLLMPWELGRCSFEASSRHIDVRNVIWLGTSNVGHDLVFEYRDALERPHEMLSREAYVELMGLLRPRVSEKLGASVLSRVTTVLPFVPFTVEELRAICFEALHNVGGDAVRSLSSEVIESVVNTALASYCPSEGARSLYRAISNKMVDII